MTAVPFIYGRPLRHDEFIGRRRELRRVVGRAKTQQNTVLVGAPHSGKTSFLYHLEGDLAKPYWGDNHDQIVFRQLDGQSLLGLQTQAAFWKYVLDWPPLFKALDNLYPVYERVEENEFGTFMLELLFKALDERRHQLILLLDEFDTFLSHPVLNSTEFYGSLRSLSSRYPSLTLILASRLTLSDLNRETQEFAPHGSPYFNIFTEYELGPLAGRDFTSLLQPAGFDTDQRRFVAELSGQQPYLT